MYGEGGTPGTVPLHNLRVTSHVLQLDVPLTSTFEVAFCLHSFWAFLGGLGRGRGCPWYSTFAKAKSHFPGRHVLEEGKRPPPPRQDSASGLY